MTVRYFLDTNVLIYGAAGKHDEPEKYRRAVTLIQQEDFGTSGQVLQEFYVNVIRKPLKPLSPLEALRWIEQLEVQPCAQIDAILVRQGIILAQRFRISYWDGAILAAAETLGARILYTEDLSHGQIYGSVRVENPFL